MRSLLTTSGLGALAVMLATPAAAQQTISTAITTPVLTNGQDISITSAGSVKPSAGAAVTINTSNSVSNQGTIAISGVNNSTGILANTSLAGTITNSGTITIDENYTPTDTDNDGDVDGPFAQGSNRFGIHVLGGGTFTGNVINSGSITVEGNQSAGIAIDSTLAGSLKMTGGTISVLGNDSFGIRAAAVTGDVSLINGTIKVQGGNSVGVAVTGDVGGMVSIQNGITATGYRSTTAPADPSKLDADDLLQGGSAVVISGNVAHGIVFDARPADASTTVTDEDSDGIPDANEGTAAIAAYGSAPAVMIGSSTADISVGTLASSTDGLVVKGGVLGAGVYSGVSGTGLQIGGLGHGVTIAGGMTVAGTISATAASANATAIHLGAGASVPAIKVTGTVQAVGAGATGTSAQAILIDSGATVGSIQNSGTIIAGRNGADGTAAAIVDKSGSVSSVQNSGSISVASSDTLGDSAVAIDLSANSGGATVQQVAAATGKPAPAIAGNILFGSGNDVLDVSAGTVTGAVRLGLGNDAVQLSGTSVLTGAIDFGGGADSLALTGTSAFHGSLANSAGATVNVGAGSTLDVTATGTVDLASLTTGAGSTLGVSLDQATGASTLFNVSGAADFGANTTVKVNLLTLGGVAGTYTIVDAGTLTGASNLTTSATSLPFLYTATVTNPTANQVALNVQLKTPEQLGLNRSEASILNAVVGAADSDAPVAQVFLGAQDSAELRASLQQMLPDHAGGAFENATKGSRLAAGILADPFAPVFDQGGTGIWAQQVAWGSSKSIGDTSSYKLSAWGAAAGIERSVGVGSVGLTAAYYAAKNDRNTNELTSSEVEGGAYWRANFGHLHAFARGTIGHVSFDSKRYFTATVDGAAVNRTATGEWSGTLTSAIGGLSYQLRAGRLSLRPNAMLEYYRLKEGGYTETGGGTAFDLSVDGRTSDESAVTGGLAVGYDFMATNTRDPWLRLELEGGRRQILSGSLGNTVARFDGGNDFTLAPDARTNGWRGALRLSGGGAGIGLTAEVNAEEQQGRASIGARAGIQLAF